MTTNEIKQAFAGWNQEHGLDSLLVLRKNLSLAIYELACEIAELEEKSKGKEAERKIQHAFKELESDKSTASARVQDAVVQTRMIREDEARLEGELKGCRIKFDALQNMSHAMASYLNKM